MFILVNSAVQVYSQRSPYICNVSSQILIYSENCCQILSNICVHIIFLIMVVLLDLSLFRDLLKFEAIFSIYSLHNYAMDAHLHIYFPFYFTWYIFV